MTPFSLPHIALYAVIRTLLTDSVIMLVRNKAEKVKWSDGVAGHSRAFSILSRRAEFGI